MIKFTNEGDCITSQELSGRGISKICTNLAGEHCYHLTEKAKAKIVSENECFYENGNGEWIRM